MILAETLSKRVSHDINARNTECFNNSLHALARSRLIDRVNTFYVEGWAVTSFNMVVKHAWLECGDMIIDPTPAYLERPALSYHTIKRFTFEDVRDLINGGHTALPFVGFNGQEWKDRELRRAYRAAVRVAYPPHFAESVLYNLDKQYPNEDAI